MRLNNWISIRWIDPFYGLNHESDVDSATSGGFGPLDGSPQTVSVQIPDETYSILVNGLSLEVEIVDSLEESFSISGLDLYVQVGYGIEYDAAVSSGFTVGTTVIASGIVVETYEISNGRFVSFKTISLLSIMADSVELASVMLLNVDSISET